MRVLGSSFLMVLWACSWSGLALADESFKTMDFATTDGIQATADVYETANPNATMIVMFHQAGWSRGEYREIAPKLVAAGYRVMAVDQRAGRAVQGVRNETHKRAVKKKLGVSYIDAYGDLVSAVEYARQRLAAKRVVVWGSSYSASLVFRLAAERPTEVFAVMAFSPGEYFKKKGPAYIQEFAKKVTQPVFVTSSKDERGMSKAISDASPSKKKVLFTPASKGQHGSRALWEKWSDHDVYWAAVKGFLTEYVPAAPPAE
jgi:dienelactone hydrolase